MHRELEYPNIPFDRFEERLDSFRKFDKPIPVRIVDCSHMSGGILCEYQDYEFKKGSHSLTRYTSKGNRKEWGSSENLYIADIRIVDNNLYLLCMSRRMDRQLKGQYLRPNLSHLWSLPKIKSATLMKLNYVMGVKPLGIR